MIKDVEEEQTLVYDAALAAAEEHARTWLTGMRDRSVPATATIDEVTAALGTELPNGSTDAAEVVHLLGSVGAPGVTAMSAGRFFGFVIGGTHPAALGADWLVSAWDQNAGMRLVTPTCSAVEDIARTWVLDLLGLPAASGVGFVTGATSANLTGLAAARHAVLRDAGWDVEARGLQGAPGVRVLVGAESHVSVQLALRYLGLGSPTTVPVDDQGRIRADELDAVLADEEGPTIVVLQAGNVHSGAFDPFEKAVAAAHARGAWVHVDGAFGLFAAASPALRPLVRGLEEADSWATDAHKTLNVTYDCGIAVVRDVAALRAAMGARASYLLTDEAGDPYEMVPEMSRRARAVPVWAVLRSLGRAGVAGLVEGFCARAAQFAAGLSALPGVTVLNEVEFTQVCVSFGDDARTRAVVNGLLADGETWMTGSRWHGQDVLRVSVSDWSTTPHDVARSVAAVDRVVQGIGA
jgi:glutamate/tyrosine decarboxylase-like PLP-dependent enzyme